MKQIILMLKQTLNSRAVIALVMLFSVSLPIITPSPPKAHAASLNVNTTADTADATPGDGTCADSNGDCSLRGAMMEANSLGGADVINVPNGTYTLASHLPYLDATDDLSIIGASPNGVIIDGVNQYMAFIIFTEDISSISLLTIKNLSIINTSYGDRDMESWVSSALSVAGANFDIDNIIFDHNQGPSAVAVADWMNSQYSGSIKNIIVKNQLSFIKYGQERATGGIGLYINGSANLAYNFQNVSLVDNTDGVFNGILLWSGSDGGNSATLTGSVENLTMANNSKAMGVFVVTDGSASNQATIQNSTFANNTYSGDIAPKNGIMVSSYGSPQFNLKNNIFANNKLNGTPANCDSNATAISLGGNLSDDNTCAAVFNQPSDKNNTNPLLGSLTQDNGQYVLPLLSGSPAIDAGISSGAPATDQRGTARPQGAGVDIGAYEFMASQGDSNTATLPNSEDTQNIQITTPAGTSISCSNSLKESEQTKQDGEYTYPLGLVEFCFSGASSSNQVTTTFVTDLTPTQVKARKYNSTTNTYFDIPGASITETTLDGKHALAVTYTITDNGDLDLDPTTGSVKDPVGLAILGATAPDTGLQRISTIPFVVAVLVGVATTATIIYGCHRKKSKV